MVGGGGVGGGGGEQKEWTDRYFLPRLRKRMMIQTAGVSKPGDGGMRRRGEGGKGDMGEVDFTMKKVSRCACKKKREREVLTRLSIIPQS